RDDRENGMLNDAVDEIHIPAGTNTEHIITTIGWEPVQAYSKYVNQRQGHPEIGYSREKRQEWGRSSIIPGAAPPSSQHADQAADEKAQNERDPNQTYSPG